MFDMLVKLYDLPEAIPGLEHLAAAGVRVERALAADKQAIVDYVRAQFSAWWASECDVAFSNRPISCFIAVKDGTVVGFACYDATARGLFGPLGVTESFRGQGIGKALLLKCLFSMREEGYAYAVIGWVEEAMEFYRRTVGAQVIEDSFPGVYRRLIGIDKVVGRG
jgi:GNAT superfamily N-acetyltransferase